MRIAVDRGHPKAVAALDDILVQQAKPGNGSGPGPAADSRAAPPRASDTALVLGMRYFEGKSAPHDDARAVSYFRQAAEAGNTNAQTMLGFMYLMGRGVGKNGPEAVKWLQKAADQNSVPALTLLADMYATGQGVPKEPMTALALRARIPPDQRKERDEFSFQLHQEFKTIHLMLGARGSRIKP